MSAPKMPPELPLRISPSSSSTHRQMQKLSGRSPTGHWRSTFSKSSATVPPRDCSRLHAFTKSDLSGQYTAARRRAKASPPESRLLHSSLGSCRRTAVI